jgi:hypothetical protein
MYETLMETAVTDENYAQALAAVKRNRGAAGIDRMTTAQLGSHLQWWILKDKLLKGTYVPSPVRRVEIPKPSGGTRMLGIPTVQDRFIQQLLLQALTPILDPNFSEHNYGSRPPHERLLRDRAPCSGPSDTTFATPQPTAVPPPQGESWLGHLVRLELIRLSEQVHA